MKKIIRSKEVRIQLVILLVAFVLICPQLFNSGSLILYTDSPFHLSRFYDTYMQIKEHNFQPFIMMYGFGSIGRYINVLYGPILSYFCGGLLYLLHSYHRFQIVFNFLVLFCAGVTTNYMLKVGRIKDGLRVYGAIIYMISYPMIAWMTKSNFMGVGAVILPLIIAVAIRMVLYPNRPVRILEMVLAMTLAMQIHMLTAIMGAVVLFIAFIYALLNRDVNKRILWQSTIVSAVITLILTANVWLVYIVLTAQNKLINPFPYSNPQEHILNWVDGRASSTAALLFITICAVFFTKLREKLSRQINFFGWLGIIITAMASGLFPWNHLFNTFNELYLLQFPFRLTSVGFLLIILTGLSGMQELVVSQKSYMLTTAGLKVVTILAIMQTTAMFANALAKWNTPFSDVQYGYVVNLTSEPYELQKAFQSKDLSAPWKVLQKSVSDYLPATKDTLKLVDPSANAVNKSVNMKILNKQYISTYINFNKFKREVKNHSIVVTWHQDSDKDITIPIAHYQGTTYRLNGKVLKSKDVKTGMSGASIVHGKKGNNKVVVGYKFHFSS